jgi:hypothetical protein
MLMSIVCLGRLILFAAFQVYLVLDALGATIEERELLTTGSCFFLAHSVSAGLVAAIFGGPEAGLYCRPFLFASQATTSGRAPHQVPLVTAHGGSQSTLPTAPAPCRAIEAANEGPPSGPALHLCGYRLRSLMTAQTLAWQVATETSLFRRRSKLCRELRC